MDVEFRGLWLGCVRIAWDDAKVKTADFAGDVLCKVVI